jgi:putative addiction module component (TIGR02574 family)
MSVDALLEAAKKLNPADRIRLVEQVWDSVAEGEPTIELTTEQLAELNRRLDRLERDGPTGQDWQSLKSDLLRDYRK